MSEFVKYNPNNSSTHPPIGKPVLVAFRISDGHGLNNSRINYTIDTMNQLFTTYPKFNKLLDDVIIGWWELPEIPNEYI